MNLANEGLEAKRKEEEVNAKKRKAEEEKVWEGAPTGSCPCNQFLILSDLETREQRVDSWRSFANSSKKKKKTKVAVLG